MSFLRNTVKEFLHKRDYFFSTGFYFSALLVGAAINLIMSPFLALYLEHSDYAIIGYYSSFNVLIGPLISFQLVNYYTRNFFLLNPAERDEAKNTILISFIFFSFLVSMFTFIGLFIYFTVMQVSFPFYPYALLTISSLFLTNFHAFLLIELKMYRNALKFFKIYVLQIMIKATAAIIFVIVFQWGAFGRMLGDALVNLAFALFVIFYLLTEWKFRKKIFLKSIAFSWPLALAAMLSYFFTGVDRAILEELNDIKSLGLYNIAISITAYLSLLGTAISDTFKPDIYQAIAKKNKKKLAILIAIKTALNIIIVTVFILVAPFAVKVLTFGRFIEATPYARILSLAIVTSGLYHSMSTIITGYGFTKTILYNKVLGAVISFAIFSYLINVFGFYGAAWGQVLSFLVMAFISFSFLYYKNFRKRSMGGK